MNWFKKIIQNFGCNHEYEFVRNIYGDEINQCGGYRSLWQCSKCGKYKYCKRLYDPIDANAPVGLTGANLKNVLSDLYDEYYEDKHENWCKDNDEFLYHITNQLIETASRGCGYDEVIMICKESTKDKYHFEKWLSKNNLEYSVSLHNQNYEHKDRNAYKFEITWI